MTISDGPFYFKYSIITFILLLLLMGISQENKKYILFSSPSEKYWNSLSSRDNHSSYLCFVSNSMKFSMCTEKTHIDREGLGWAMYDYMRKLVYCWGVRSRNAPIMESGSLFLTPGEIQ